MQIALQPALPDVSALERFLEKSGALPHTAAKLSEMCRKPEPETRFIAAYDSDRLVGFGCWSASAPGTSAEIAMAVDPAYAGREIAGPMRKLLVPAKSGCTAGSTFQSA